MSRAHRSGQIFVYTVASFQCEISGKEKKSGPWTGQKAPSAKRPVSHEGGTRVSVSQGQYILEPDEDMVGKHLNHKIIIFTSVWKFMAKPGNISQTWILWSGPKSKVTKK